jgi:hypothetical protein
MMLTLNFYFFKRKVNGEIVKVDIINLFGFILRNIIFEVGRKLYTRSSQLHLQGVGTSILQTFLNCEE